MNQIDNLTAQATQTTDVALPDGSILSLTLTYMAAIQRWVVDVAHPLLTTAGLAVVMHPNMLRDWRNLIPFGLACVTTNGLDPLNVDDFANGNASLFVLTADEVVQVETTIYGGNLQ